MTTISEGLKKLKALKKDITTIGATVMRETEEYFLDYNKMQMSEGIRSDNQRIGVYRWDSYERFKAQRFPQSGGWINLELRGDFKASMKVKLTAKKWEIYNTDSKEKQLKGFSWWNDAIYGLTDQNMEEYRQKFFLPLFQQRVRNYLNG